MGKLMSKASRKTVQKVNVENRAHRVIEKAERTKPKTAPKHPTTVQAIEKIQEEHPEWLEEQKNKNTTLDSMLKGMVVNPERFGEITTKTRALPENRAKGDDPEYGYLEPDYIRPGRCSIRQAIEFIGLHADNPQENPAQNIASKYKLSVENAEDTIKYFQTFEIQLPRALREKLGIEDPKKQTQNILRGSHKDLKPGKVDES